MGHSRCRGSRPPSELYADVLGRRTSMSVATWWRCTPGHGGPWRFFRDLTRATSLWWFLFFGWPPSVGPDVVYCISHVLYVWVLRYICMTKHYASYIVLPLYYSIYMYEWYYCCILWYYCSSLFSFFLECRWLKYIIVTLCHVRDGPMILVICTSTELVHPTWVTGSIPQITCVCPM